MQKRIQELVSGNRPRNPALSELSTRRLILEGIIEEVKIYRLTKEEKARKAREEACSMYKNMTGKEKESDREYRRRRSSRSNSRSRGRPRDRTPERHDQDDTLDLELEHASLVSGETNRYNDDPRYMMTGALPPGATIPASPSPLPKGPKTPSKSRSRSISPERGRSHHNHRQRYDARGKPLVRGKRGWRDASVGSPPKYQFKKGLTLGLGTHIKKCMQWGKEDYMLQQRKKERKARGTLEERKLAKKERKAARDERRKHREEGYESRIGGRYREESSRRHGNDEKNRERYDHRERHQAENELTPRHKDSRRHRGYRGDSTPESRYSPEHKARAGARARSRGERLAEKVSRSESPRNEQPTPHEPPPPPPEPYNITPDEEGPLPSSPQVRFRSRTSTIKTREPASGSRSSPNSTAVLPSPIYEQTAHSRSTEDRERAQTETTDPPSSERQSTYSPTPHSRSVEDREREQAEESAHETTVRSRSPSPYPTLSDKDSIYRPRTRSHSRSTERGSPSQTRTRYHSPSPSPSLTPFPSRSPTLSITSSRYSDSSDNSPTVSRALAQTRPSTPFSSLSPTSSITLSRYSDDSDNSPATSRARAQARYSAPSPIPSNYSDSNNGSISPPIINRDAQLAEDGATDDSTLVSDWWSERTDTPSDDDHNPTPTHSRGNESTARINEWRTDTENRGRGPEKDSRYMSGNEEGGRDKDEPRHLRVSEQKGPPRSRSVSPPDTDDWSMIGRLAAHVGRGRDVERRRRRRGDD
ncbi:hypothetical protein P280DRAFT_533584 [Massarina eburnea CBS 473.64]|uniref:Uncharacterized protein n=1 Tax=Massarina eburnea CBS 473.64 TaxID=1395130 RepID=A0A6A6RPW0_9PLEO|nr:hypothetical protein P280DRAFT_533584 [Massarina eburnea CBS 473.64]